MNKMVSLMGRGKWVVLAAALVACGGADPQFSGAGAGGAKANAALDPAAGGPAGGGGAIAIAVAHEAGQAGSAAIEDGGSAGEATLTMAGAPAEAQGGALAAGGAAAAGSPVAGAPAGGQASGGGGQAAGGAGAAGQGGGGGDALCECSVGACCDGCHAKLSGQLAESNLRVSSGCIPSTDGSTSRSLHNDIGDLLCDGHSFDGSVVGTITQVDVVDCAQDFVCVPAGVATPGIPAFPNATCRKL